MGSRTRAKCISQRSLGRRRREGRQGEHDLKTIRGTIPHVRSGNGTTAMLRLQCFSCIAVTPSPPPFHPSHPPIPHPIHLQSFTRTRTLLNPPHGLSAWCARKFSLPRAIQFQINYASGCPRARAVGRRIILRRFTPPRPKEAANKPASISRHATPLSARGAYGVRN